MNNKVSYLQELVSFVSIYCGDWVHTAVMMRLPNPLDVRGGEFPSAYDFVQENSRWVSSGNSKAKKNERNPQEILKSILSVISPGSDRNITPRSRLQHCKSRCTGLN